MTDFWWSPFFLPALKWWVWMLALAALAWPLCNRACPLLPDRGWTLARLLGPALVAFFRAWTAWILPERAAQTPPVYFAWAGVLMLGFFSGMLLLRDGPRLATLVRKQGRCLLVYEAFLLAAFLAYLILRSYFPDTTFDAMGFYGAEKWGNFALLTQLTQNAPIPPQDPWLAGYSVNYYYFSHLLWATLACLSGTVPEVAFNFSLAGLFTLLLALAFSIGYALREHWAAGIGAVFLIGLAGPLAAWSQFPDMLQAFGANAAGWAAFDFWAPSDCIPHTRNEFPAFNWLLGDLHAHGTGLLVFLAGLLMLVQLRRFLETDPRRWARIPLAQPLWAALFVWLLGLMWVCNSWDVLVFLLPLGLYGMGHSFQVGESRADRLNRMVQFLLLLALTLLVSLRLLFPFYTSVVRPPLDTVHTAWLAKLPSLLGMLGHVGWVGQPSSLGALFALWGLFALPLGVLVALPVFQKRSSFWNHPALTALLGGMLILALGPYLLPGFSRTLFFLVVSGAALAALLWQNRKNPWAQGESWGLLFLLAAVTALLLTETFYVDDPIGPPYERYNTVFKIGYPAWALFALSLVCLFPAWKKEPGDLKKWRDKALFLGLALFLLLGGGLYTLLGSLSRVGQSKAREAQLVEKGMAPEKARPLCRTLDGLAFMKMPGYSAEDLALARWMRESPLLAEASLLLEWSGESYTMAGRFATITGIPCLLGWENHQSQWRGQAFSEDVWQKRHSFIRQVYQTPDAELAAQWCRQMGIRWVLLGKLERENTSAAAQEKFDHFALPVHQAGQSRLYFIPGDEPPRP